MYVVYKIQDQKVLFLRSIRRMEFSTDIHMAKLYIRKDNAVTASKRITNGKIKELKKIEKNEDI